MPGLEHCCQLLNANKMVYLFHFCSALLVFGCAVGLILFLSRVVLSSILNLLHPILLMNWQMIHAIIDRAPLLLLLYLLDVAVGVTRTEKVIDSSLLTVSAGSPPTRPSVSTDGIRVLSIFLLSVFVQRLKPTKS